MNNVTAAGVAGRVLRLEDQRQALMRRRRQSRTHLVSVPHEAPVGVPEHHIAAVPAEGEGGVLADEVATVAGVITRRRRTRRNPHRSTLLKWPTRGHEPRRRRRAEMGL
ncbi:unnamed protein product [Spirodela intermedia]|uniref:Uncharacterized protein n=1 Tax=Spirodela intermedia TaxID=51605 RepID=A0A7I8J9Q9_SPIIN|nr:unnamed protein product [Spirodela intermedia]CAA6666958.1 unnamed protein product [Spirodela intermedia]